MTDEIFKVKINIAPVVMKDTLNPVTPRGLNMQ